MASKPIYFCQKAFNIAKIVYMEKRNITIRKCLYEVTNKEVNSDTKKILYIKLLEYTHASVIAEGFIISATV